MMLRDRARTRRWNPSAARASASGWQDPTDRWTASPFEREDIEALGSALQ